MVIAGFKEKLSCVCIQYANIPVICSLIMAEDIIIFSMMQFLIPVFTRYDLLFVLARVRFCFFLLNVSGNNWPVYV